MPRPRRILTLHIKDYIVAGWTALQRCPSCHATKGLWLWAIEPHVVVWCRPCQRVWAHPTLTWNPVAGLIAAAILAPDSLSPYKNELADIPVLDDDPEIRRLVETVDSLAPGGLPTSYRRLGLKEFFAFQAERPLTLRRQWFGREVLLARGRIGRWNVALRDMLRR